MKTLTKVLLGLSVASFGAAIVKHNYGKVKEAQVDRKETKTDTPVKPVELKEKTVIGSKGTINHCTNGKFKAFNRAMTMTIEGVDVHLDTELKKEKFEYKIVFKCEDSKRDAVVAETLKQFKVLTTFTRASKQTTESELVELFNDVTKSNLKFL